MEGQCLVLKAARSDRETKSPNHGVSGPFITGTLQFQEHQLIIMLNVTALKRF